MYLDVSKRFLDSLVDNTIQCSEKLFGRHLTKSGLKRNIDKIIAGDLKKLDVSNIKTKEEFLYLVVNENYIPWSNPICTKGHKNFEFTNLYFKNPVQELLAVLLTTDKLKKPLEFEGKIYKIKSFIYKNNSMNLKSFKRIKDMLENYVYNVGGTKLKITDKLDEYKIEFSVKIPNEAPFSENLSDLLQIMAENYEQILKKVAFREISKNNYEIMELLNEKIKNKDTLIERVIKLFERRN